MFEVSSWGEEDHNWKSNCWLDVRVGGRDRED